MCVLTLAVSGTLITSSLLSQKKVLESTEKIPSTCTQRKKEGVGEKERGVCGLGEGSI